MYTYIDALYSVSSLSARHREVFSGWRGNRISTGTQAGSRFAAVRCGGYAEVVRNRDFIVDVEEVWEGNGYNVGI